MALAEEAAFCYLVSCGLFLILQTSCVTVITFIWEIEMLIGFGGMVSSRLGISHC